MTIDYRNFFTQQLNIHPNLTHMVLKYAKTSFKRPIPSHQLEAFKAIKAFVKTRDRPLILDSGCGTGFSSIRLAELFPHHGIIGVDKSLARINRNKIALPPNVLIIRGELLDIWRLLVNERLNISHHYLLFPNPWPKIGHLGRRFYAHPIFNTMISLAPRFEMRTNWLIYALECETALKILGHHPTLEKKTGESYMTLFEKKYVEAKCPIYIVKNLIA